MSIFFGQQIDWNGDPWEIGGLGVIDNQGRIYCHLASTSRFRQQANERNPIQACDWVPAGLIGDRCLDCDGEGAHPSGAKCKSCGGDRLVLHGDGEKMPAVPTMSVRQSQSEWRSNF